MHGLARLLAVMVMLLGGACAAADQATTDLSKIERRLGKEPKYEGKPGYLLLVFGPDARHKVWLVLDGKTLYVDRHADGDLTRPECRLPGESDDYCDGLFKAGDLRLGGQVYANLQVAVYNAKSCIGSAHAEMPMFKEFLDAHPEGKLFTVSVDVPFEKALPGLGDGPPVKGTRHFAGRYDNTGILQFAARPEDASVIHFGGRWSFAPDGQQKLVRGRNHDLALKLGTPGRGPGSLAFICYTNLIPDAAKPRLRIEYPLESKDEALIQNWVLEDRC